MPSNNLRFGLYLVIFGLTFSFPTISDLPRKFNITIKTPENDLLPTKIPYKSIHVKYTLANSDEQCNIVAAEPFIPTSDGLIQQMTVHICQKPSISYQQNAVWYDDQTYCNGAQSMLIYQWKPNSPLSTFQISDDLGFQLDKSKSIVLTIVYSKEQNSHPDTSGVILYISTQIQRFHLGTITVGNNRRGMRFSCRSSNYPRLFYAVKPLFLKMNNAWWSIYVIRNRSFGRKLTQSVLDSSTFIPENQTDLVVVSPDIFLISGDYLIIECTDMIESNCEFLIFYTYKNSNNENFDDNDHTCRNNDYPDLFKSIPPKTTPIVKPVPEMDGIKIFLLLCLLLFVVWISIIVGCIIVRHIRGLVNMRAETPAQCAYRSKSGPAPRSPAHDQQHQRTIAEGDRVAQMDVEHMGLM